MPLQTHIVVEIANHAHFMAVDERTRQLHAGVAGAIDQGLWQRVTIEQISIQSAEPEADQQSRTGHRQKQQHRLNQPYRARHARHPDRRINGGIEHGIDCHGTRHCQRCLPAGIAENCAIQAGDDENWQCEGQCPGKGTNGLPLSSPRKGSPTPRGADKTPAKPSARTVLRRNPRPRRA